MSRLEIDLYHVQFLFHEKRPLPYSLTYSNVMELNDYRFHRFVHTE
jgi:hypothetical protein